MKRRALFCVVVAVTASMFACNVSDAVLENAKVRIDALKTKGLPDSLTSPAEVAYEAAKMAKEQDKYSKSRSAAKTMQSELVKAETFYTTTIAPLTTSIDSLKKVIATARTNYTGVTLKRFDSLSRSVDSLLTKDWVLRAYTAIKKAADRISEFDALKAKGEALKGEASGEWSCIVPTTSKEFPQVNGIEKKIFTFRKDGTASFVETQKGQFDQYLKKDVEFHSNGTWQMHGDTVYLLTTRFARVKESFDQLFESNGGKTKEWRKKSEPPYDSAITDVSQDRYISLGDLKEDFTHKK